MLLCRCYSSQGLFPAPGPTFEKASMVCSLSCLPRPRSPSLSAPLAPTSTLAGCRAKQPPSKYHDHRTWPMHNHEGIETKRLQLDCWSNLVFKSMHDFPWQHFPAWLASCNHMISPEKSEYTQKSLGHAATQIQARAIPWYRICMIHNSSTCLPALTSWILLCW